MMLFYNAGEELQVPSMTANYHIDGEMIYNSVKSESHTFFSSSEIPFILEEARKKKKANL